MRSVTGPTFSMRPFELFCCPDLKFPVAAGWTFRCLGFGKSGTACCRRCRGAYGKRVPGCGDASRRRRNPPLCRRPASNFANGSVLPLDLGKVTFVTFGQDFGEKGTVFELFSCNFGNPRLTIAAVKPVARVLLAGWSALSTRANTELARASAQPLQQPDPSRNAGARLSCRTQIPYDGAFPVRRGMPWEPRMRHRRPRLHHQIQTSRKERVIRYEHRNDLHASRFRQDGRRHRCRRRAGCRRC